MNDNTYEPTDVEPRSNIVESPLVRGLIRTDDAYEVMADGAGEQYREDTETATMAEVDHEFSDYDWSPW